MYCGSVGTLTRPKDRFFRRSLKILNIYERALVKRLSILLGFQQSMKNRTRQLVPHQTCDLLCLNICSLRTTTYVRCFLPQFSLHLYLLSEKRTTFYLAYLGTHSQFRALLILKVLSRLKISKGRNWLSIHQHIRVASLLLLYPHHHHHHPRSTPM